MKREKGKETFSIIVSVILALGLFLFLLAGLGWNLILCMVLGAAAYAAFADSKNSLAGRACMAYPFALTAQFFNT